MKKFIDVGVNLTDKMYKGIYNEKVKHQEDILNVLNRAFEAGIEKLIVLSGSLSDSNEALTLSKMDSRLSVTVGCHPTNCNELINDPENYIMDLTKLATNNRRVVAIGECGLDYDREHFCPRQVQQQFFERQIQLAIDLQLPLYLHCRAAHDDLISILKRYHTQLPENRPGVVHTFDGSRNHADQLLAMGFYLGINGCSLKTDDNLEVLKSLPLNRLVLETDAPWCDVRPTHAGYKYVRTFADASKREKWRPNATVKGRNEPVNLVQIFEIVCAVRDEDAAVICDALFDNAVALFGLL